MEREAFQVKRGGTFPRGPAEPESLGLEGRGVRGENAEGLCECTAPGCGERSFLASHLSIALP